MLITWVTKRLFRYLVTIAPVSTVAVLSTAIVLVFAVAIQSSVEAASSYKVYVRLDNVGYNVGLYDVKVTINGITKTKYSVDTGGQTCPDDVQVACYTNAGSSKFGKTKKGLDIEVCAEPISSYDIQCSYYVTNGKKKQYVSVIVPNLNPDYQS